MAAMISSSNCPCERWALSAVPWKLPRTLVGMAMSASACAMASRAWPSDMPGSRLNEMVVASSPSWWLTEVGAACSNTRAMAPCRTMVAAAEPITSPPQPPPTPRVGGRAWHCVCPCGAARHLHASQRCRPLPVLGCPFHDHGVLVEIAINRGHGALSKGVVQGTVDGGSTHAQPRGAVAIDLHMGLHAVIGL